jgi:ABC-type nitrate/sulfonate/bicarbonate transport system ATPase subunit
MIEVEGLTFSYGPWPLFQGFSWKIETGDFWAVIGPSGCGKSTLLTLLAGLRLPQGGTIRIQGQPLLRPRPQTGLILQDFGLLPWATVRQNVELGLKIRRFYGPDGIHAPRHPRRGHSVDFWLEKLDIAQVADRYPSQISGGQRQRAAIARTLVLRPGLLLMDEPFASLDAPTREALQKRIRELADEQGLTIVLVTHAIEEAALLGNKILVLGKPPHLRSEVLENPGALGPGGRDSREFRETCRLLRQALEGGDER